MSAQLICRCKNARHTPCPHILYCQIQFCLFLFRGRFGLTIRSPAHRHGLLRNSYTIDITQYTFQARQYAFILYVQYYLFHYLFSFCAAKLLLFNHIYKGMLHFLWGRRCAWGTTRLASSKSFRVMPKCRQNQHHYFRVMNLIHQTVFTV